MNARKVLGHHLRGGFELFKTLFVWAVIGMLALMIPAIWGYDVAIFLFQHFPQALIMVALWVFALSRVVYYFGNIKKIPTEWHFLFFPITVGWFLLMLLESETIGRFLYIYFFL